jgi:hypothetical protein
MPNVGGYIAATERLTADTIRICYGGLLAEVLLSGTPVVRDFDLVTNTIGAAVYNLDAYTLDKPRFTGYHRSSINAEDRIFAHTNIPAALDSSITLYRRDDSLGFFASILITDNVLLPAQKTCALEAIFMDPAGTSHVLYSERPRAPLAQKPRTIYYRQIDAAGAMTAAVVVYTYQFESQQTFGFPGLVGNKLVFPFPLENGTSELDQFWTGAVLIMDPYTALAPVISQVAVPTQQLTLDATAVCANIHAAPLGGGLHLWWLEQRALDGVTPLSRIMYATFDGVAVGAPAVFYDAIANPAPFPAPGATLTFLSPPLMDVVDPMLVVAMNNIGFFWFAGLAPPAVAAILQRTEFRRMVVLIPNRFDLCLRWDGEVYHKHQPRRECCRPILWRDINWVRAPQDYIPFRRTAGIPTPLAASGDVEVLNFEVPPGYDGLIAGLFNMYTGPGFREGNGDIEWRLMVNRTYAIHLGRIMVSLGGQDQPYPVDGGIFVQSGTRVRYIVSVPNLSGGILPLASRIVCGLEGLFYARTQLRM